MTDGYEKAPDLPQAALDAVSGKFQSKDDPDNKEITLQPLSDDYFCNSAELCHLQLHKDNNTKINEVVLEISVFVRVPESPDAHPVRPSR